MSRSPSRWASATGGGRGRAYAARFARLAESGSDVHGEASLCARLVPPGSRVLDAGCGTGRVAVRLAELGYRCVGVDSDESMIAVARQAATDVAWLHADLTDLTDRPADPLHLLHPPDLAEPFDLVVAAGNVVPLLAPGTEAAVVTGLARCLARGGLLVAGFGLDAAHLPLAEAPFGLVDYDAWCADAGLVLQARYATWDGADFDTVGAQHAGAQHAGYAVSIHRLRLPAPPPSSTAPMTDSPPSPTRPLAVPGGA